MSHFGKISPDIVSIPNGSIKMQRFLKMAAAKLVSIPNGSIKIIARLQRQGLWRVSIPNGSIKISAEIDGYQKSDSFNSKWFD